MLMVRKYSPRFATPSEIEAGRYAAELVWPAALVGFLLRFPMPQGLAALLVVALLVHVIIVGKSFRIHQPDFAKELPFWKQLWVLRSAAKFVLVSTIVVGVALGQTQWEGRTAAVHDIFNWAVMLKNMTMAL
ncbi:hypothetical protein ABE521_00430 [Pseudomonas sp. TWI672]|uniref:hypothetical protein n=1 Tax=unclassified Pseudomonas TaxID=196821 RepID=UPI00320A269F